MPVAARTDQEIQQDVLRELQWDSRVDGAEIGIEVSGGIVTLTGTVDGESRKHAARGAALRVIGVLRVADEIQVHSPGVPQRTDGDIARTVRLTLEWDPFLPDRKIRSAVSEGRVTLEGEVSTPREKEDAERVVRVLAGVQSVHNLLEVSRDHRRSASPPPIHRRRARARGGAGSGEDQRQHRRGYRYARRQGPDLAGEELGPGNSQSRSRSSRGEGPLVRRSLELIRAAESGGFDENRHEHQ